MLTQPWFPIVLIVLYRPRNQKKLFQPSPFGVWVVNESPIDNSFDTFKRTHGIDYSHIIQSNHRIVFWYYLYHSRCSLPTRPAPKHCVMIEDDITRFQRFIRCLAWVILIAVTYEINSKCKLFSICWTYLVKYTLIVSLLTSQMSQCCPHRRHLVR